MCDTNYWLRRCGARMSTAVCVTLLTGPVGAQQTEKGNPRDEIDEITVTATPLSRTVRQLAQPISVLSGDELQRKQSTSIGETVSGELGVSSTYFGPIASRPVIRGQYGERVRVLSNSLDALDASALSEDHQVSLEGILADRVEIVRGPATLLYGSGAAGGLVNIVDERIIEQALTEPFSGSASLGTDSAVGERAAAAEVAFGSERVGVHLDYFRRDTDDVDIPGFAETALFRAQEEAEEEGGGEEEEAEAFGVVENTDSETDGGAAGLSLTGDRGYLGVSLSRFNSNYGIPGHHHHHEEAADAAPEEEEAPVRIDLEQNRIDLRGQYEFSGPISSVKVRLAQSDYQHQELEGDEIGTRFDIDGTDARVELRHADLGALQGAFGMQFQRTDFAALGEEAFVPASDTRRASLFGFEEYALNDAWILQMSARAERQTIDVDTAAGPDYRDTAYGASVGAIWSFSEGYSLSANYALAERHPNSTELYADGPHLAVQRFERGSVTLGDGILGKEVSSNFDLTLRGQNQRLDWTLTAFVNDVDDYILLTSTGLEEDELPVFEYGQADVQFYGFEGEGRLELLNSEAGHLHARLFGDYVYAEEKDSGAYLPRLTPLRYGVGLDFERNRFTASADAIYHDRQDKTGPHELPTDSYMLLSAELSWLLEQHGLMLFIRGTNLTDEDARQHSSPLKDIVPLPGSSLHLGLRYDF